jgi:hypothetical protein
MSTSTDFASFEEFWPYYVGEHANKLTRNLHFVGTSSAVATVAYALLTRKFKLLPLALVAGYGPSWIGHFFIEKNKPATFKYPLWSLRGDFKMIAKMLDGSMDAEVARVIAEREAKAAQSNGKGNGPVDGPHPMAN